MSETKEQTKKEITFEDIQKANETIRTTDIKGKEYAEVNQRIKAFRMNYPTGFIRTNMESNEDGVCVFRAQVGFYKFNDGESPSFHKEVLLGTGYAYEKESSSYINKTSYIENCETSAVGRALGMCGYGIDTSVASAEEVQNAINNQNPKDTKKATAKQVELIKSKFTGGNIEEWLQRTYGISKVEDLSLAQADELVKKIGGKK